MNWLKKKFSKFKLTNFLLSLIIPFIIIIVWHIASLNSVVVPSIGEVLDVLFHPFREVMIDSKPLGDSLLISFTRVFLGVSLAILTGVPLGLISGRNKYIRSIFQPIFELLRTICPVSWMPIAIIAFGFMSFSSVINGSDLSYKWDFFDEIKIAMIAIIWWGAFFPIYIGSLNGALRVSKNHLEVAKLMGAKKYFLFKKIIFPASLPDVLTGTKIGMGIGWMVIIAAEWFPGTRSGLGNMISEAHQQADYHYAFAAIIAIGMTGLTINTLFSMLTDPLISWKKDS